jgi:UDP-N-acetylmuramate--alanine ligase
VRRRFEIVARTPRMTIVDDYAHHPTAVAATIAAARGGFAGPIVVAFQPHRYSRTSYLAADFARALHGADRVLLTGVYAASERPIDGVDARSIGEPLRALGTEVEYVDDVEALPESLLACAPEGALVLFLGAGSITSGAAALARELERRAVAR